MTWLNELKVQGVLRIKADNFLEEESGAKCCILLGTWH